MTGRPVAKFENLNQQSGYLGLTHIHGPVTAMEHRKKLENEKTKQ
jgi:hypothetical protein